METIDLACQVCDFFEKKLEENQGNFVVEIKCADEGRSIVCGHRFIEHLESTGHFNMVPFVKEDFNGNDVYHFQYWESTSLINMKFSSIEIAGYLAAAFVRYIKAGINLKVTDDRIVFEI